MKRNNKMRILMVAKPLVFVIALLFCGKCPLGPRVIKREALLRKRLRQRQGQRRTEYARTRPASAAVGIRSTLCRMAPGILTERMLLMGFLWTLACLFPMEMVGWYGEHSRKNKVKI